VTGASPILRDEGRADPAGEGARRRSRGPGHSREHDLAGRDRDTAHAPTVEGHGRGARDDGAEAPPGAARPPRRDCPRGTLPRQRRVRLHDGERPPHRRRLHGGVTMSAALSPTDVARYSRDGSLSPNRALTAAEAATCLEQLAAFERTVGGPLTADQTARHRSRTHVLLTWVHALVGRPPILDAVASIIGPTILLYTSTWFINGPPS